MTVNLSTTIATRSYSTKSNANRAAKSANLTTYTIHFDQGNYYVIPGPTVNTTGDQLGGAPTADLPTIAPTTPTVTKVPTHKVFARYDHSSVVKPVAYVHGYLNQYGWTLTRKAALANLCGLGINYSTARTQYQVWFVGKRTNTVG